MATFGQIIDKNKGATSGFDYMRLVLAVAVVVWHSFEVAYGMDYVQTMAKNWYGMAVFFIMPMFFALSGFLVSASLLRSKTIWEFAGLRILRIVPALGVEIGLSAFLLGAAVTEFPLREYYAGSDFYSYFLNIIGYIHYTLPGVFLNNPVSETVNSSLWTVPFELECYVALCVLALLKVAKSPRFMFASLMAFSLSLLAYKLYKYQSADVSSVNATGRQLVLFFLGGVTLFMARNKIPHHFGLFCVALAFTLITLKSGRAIYLSVLPVAYITAYLGLLTPKKLPIIFTGDYSYGIYLYAYPIQQSVQALHAYEWYSNLIISLVFIGAFASFSWHCIEKPMLGFKKYLRRQPVETVILQSPLPQAM